jgi:hypothetical protein
MSRLPFLSVQITEPIRVALIAAAAAAETSISGYVRAVIVKALPNGGALPPLPLSPPQRRRHIPDADVVVVANALTAINRLNGAMVQLSKALREAGHVPEHDAMESALRDVRDLKAEGVSLFRRLK